MNRIFIAFLLLVPGMISSQPWTQNDNIFNPSGVPSLPFSQPRFGDLDGDGDFDLVIGSTGENPFYLENTGTETNPAFVPGPDLFAGVSSLDAEMGVFFDIDDDSDLDFITGGFTGLNLFRNTGTLTNPVFQKEEGFFSGLSVGMSPVPDLADIDDDGDPDMVVGLSESGLVKLYTNTGSPTSAIFSEAEMYEIGDVGLYAYPNFCDIDDDNDMDLIVGRDEHGFIYYKNTGNSATAVWEADTLTFAGLGMSTYWNSPGLADLNDDGNVDLVFGTYTGPLNYFNNSGTPEIPVWTENTSLFGGVIDVGAASNPVFYDFDGDGDLDMFTGTQLGNIKYYENTGTMYGPAWVENSAPFTSLTHSIYSAVAIGDVNNDDLPDAIVGDLNGHLYYHRNTGDGFVEETGYLQSIALGGWSAPRLVDFDNDEDLDIIAGNENGNLAYIQNEGTPINPDWNLISGFFGSIDVGMNCVPTIADVDFDGDPDILCGNLSGNLSYFENQGGEWFQNNEIFQGISGGQNTTPALADLDGDGDPDLTMGQYTGIFSYYVNHAINTGVEDQEITKANLQASVYPNPVKGAANISIDLPAAARIHIRLLTFAGQLVKNFKRDISTSGHQIISWDATALPPGIYFIQLNVPQGNVVVKMIKL